jgi:hypothetical protein
LLLTSEDERRKMKQGLPQVASPAAAPVYRSIPITTSAASFDRLRTERDLVFNCKVTPIERVQETQKNQLPVVPFVSLLEGAFYRDNVDLGDIQQKLSGVCSSCVLTQNDSVCEFDCLAEAKDGNEVCKFSVNLWSQSAAPSCVIQVDRHAGCPYFFKKIIAQTINEMDSSNLKMFRVPKLPDSMVDEETIDAQFVENIIALAISELLEERLSGLLVLANLCSADPRFISVFKDLNGIERLTPLRTDSNVYVQKALSRILVL